MEQIVSRQGETIDAVVYRHYRDNDMTSKVIAENPKLANLPPILPEGTLVNVPAKQVKTTKRRIW